VSRGVVLGILMLVVLVSLLAFLAYTRAMERRRMRRARWEVETHALPDGGHRVALHCEGEPPQEVRRLPPGLESDELGDRLAEAMSEAEARAATLNAARPRG